MQNNTTIKLILCQQLHVNNENIELNGIIKLLLALKKQPNLRNAAAEIGYSYRKAWNLLKNIEQQLKVNILLMERGRGTRLTDLGIKLLDILQDNQQALDSQLTKNSQVATTVLQQLLEQSQRLKIIASDHESLCRLREKMPLSLEIMGSVNALKAYTQGRCALAGFHLPTGELGRIMLSRYQNYLRHENYCFFLVDQREQGIISSPSQPVENLEQIINQGLRFVNRQQDSGTRDLLDILLEQANLDSQQLNGYSHEEHTHLAVASLIAAKEAEAGLGIKSAAERLNLYFMPIIKECYFLLLSVELLDSVKVKELLALLFPEKKSIAMNYSQLEQLITRSFN